MGPGPLQKLGLHDTARVCNVNRHAGHGAGLCSLSMSQKRVVCCSHREGSELVDGNRHEKVFRRTI